MKLLFTLLICFPFAVFSNTAPEYNPEHEKIVKFIEIPTDLYNNKQYTKSISVTLEMLKSQKMTPDERSHLYNLITECYLALENHEGAMKYKQMQIEWCEKNNLSTVTLFYAYDLLANMKLENGEKQKAIYYQKKGVKIARELKDTIIQLLALNNMGFIYRHLGNDELAREYYEKGIQLTKDYKRKDDRFKILSAVLEGNLGEVILPYDPARGEKLLKKAITVMDQGHDVSNQIAYRCYLGKYYLTSGNLLEADRYLSEADEFAVSINDYWYQYEIQLDKLVLYSLKNNRFKIVETRAKLDVIHERLVDKKKLYKASHELSELKLKNIRNELSVSAQANSTKTIFIITGIIIAILTIVILFMINNKNKQSRLKEEQVYKLKEDIFNLKLDKQSAELTEVTKWFNEQREELSFLLLNSKTREDELIKIIQDVKSMKRENTSDVNQILSEIQMKLNSINSIDKEMAPSTIPQNMDASVKVRFTNKMKEQFPELTKNDLDLCFMILSGLDNKEIGNLKNISLNSVRTFKYRLKQRLHLNPSTELLDFLKSQL